VELRKKVNSYILLGIYLIVLLHGVSDTTLFTNGSKSKVSHKHDHFKDAHHDHHFHIGIFHFLGHLFESINQSDNPSDEHLVFIEKTRTKDDINSKSSTDCFYLWHHAIVNQRDVQSKSDPPIFHQFLLHRLIQPNSYLRGPPTLV
jgi:hypothetical protein